MPHWTFRYLNDDPEEVAELNQIEAYIRSIAGPRDIIERRRDSVFEILTFMTSGPALGDRPPERVRTRSPHRGPIHRPLIQGAASDLSQWENIRLPEGWSVESMTHDYASVTVPESDLHAAMEYAMQASFEAVRIPKEIMEAILVPKSLPPPPPKTRFDLINESFG